DRSGITTVEFAMIATPFLGVLFAIVETALLLFSGQALDTALQDASRRIMTGEAQGAAMSAEDFRQDVCGRMPALILNCNDSLFIDVRSFTSAAPAPTKPIDS